ncbi:DNA-directed RNA polymerase III complex subunit Rpc25 [Glugoides intestinalis]
MFILSEIQDNVEIRTASENKEIAILEALKLKYSNKMLESLGLCLFIVKVVEISEFEIQAELLVANVTFEAVFYRLYPGEIVNGKIIRQEEEKLVVEDNLHIIYEVCAADMFENCEFDGEGDDPHWIWNYKNNQLTFITGDIVRLGVKQYRDIDFNVDGCINEHGLGPISWWD